MRNIVKLFRRDLHNVSQSVIGLIVCVGLVILPVLYAWFNIAGSWDPYGNTGNLKVAVANSDAGYKSDLIPVEVNLGDSVTGALRENDQLGWVFVDEEDAIEGVKSGEYYAAVVIPKDFSANMMTLFSTEVEHSDIIYYENQKASAIAPRVTDKGASTVRKQIDETFTATVNDIGLATVSGLMDYMSSDEIMNYIGNLSRSLEDGITSLRDAASNTGSFAGVIGSTSDALTSSGNILSDSGTLSDQAGSLLADAKTGLSGIEGALSGTTDAVNTALSDSASSFDDVSDALDEAFGAAGDHVDTTVSQLHAVASSIDEDAETTAGIAGELYALAERAAEDGRDTLAAALTRVGDGVQAVSDKQKRVVASIEAAADSLESGAQDVSSARAEVESLIADAKASVATVKGEYETTLKSDAGELKDTIAGIADASSGISDSLDETVAGLNETTGSLAENLSGTGGMLTDASTKLDGAADKLEELKDKLEDAMTSGDLQTIRDLIGSDPEALASVLAAPVSLDRKPVYAVSNYGSAMAPFYTVLSLWVGGIVLAAMMRVSVDDALVRELMPVRLHELYLGRYCLFALLALAQATLVCAGDILFFGIQCDSPVQFLLTGWLAALVFSNIVYTLTVSFGDIGKAIAVVLLVMQVAGSGGTFPIEMTADFFQAVYPFLPFTHAINAMHAAMAGAYGMEYWIEMGLLALYLIPSLALGLALRRPVIRANNWIIEKLEETKLM